MSSLFSPVSWLTSEGRGDGGRGEGEERGKRRERGKGGQELKGERVKGGD